MSEIEKAIQVLKETYPDVIKICDNWAMFCHIHGEKQSEEERKILDKFSTAMKVITGKTKEVERS